MARKKIFGGTGALALAFLLLLALLRIALVHRRATVPALTLSFPMWQDPFSSSRPAMRTHCRGLAFLPQTNSTPTRLWMVDDFARWYEGDLATAQFRQTGKRDVISGAFTFTPKREAIVTTGDGRFARYNFQTQRFFEKILAELTYPERPAMAVSADGSLALISTYHELDGPWKNGDLWLSRTASGKLLWGETLKAAADGSLPIVRGRAFAPDGKTVAVAKYYLGATGPYPSTAQQKSATLQAARRSSMLLEGKRLEIELRNVADGRILRTFSWRLPLPTHPMNGDGLTQGVTLAFSPDGQNLLAASLQDAAVFSIPGGALRASLPRPKKANLLKETAVVAFSPNGKLLALCRSNLIEIYDAKTFRQLQIFYAAAQVLAFSPDGKWLACDDNMTRPQSVLVWETGSLN